MTGIIATGYFLKQNHNQAIIAVGFSQRMKVKPIPALVKPLKNLK